MDRGLTPAPLERKSSHIAGILTGGGNCPGINDAIHGAAKLATARGWIVLGIEHGYKGLLSGRKFKEIHAYVPGGCLDNLYRKPGSVLGLSRTNPAPENNLEIFDRNARIIREVIKKNRIDVLIAIGGDDTLGAARRLTEAGVLRANGAPKTIDNDIKGTQCSFGHRTAVEAGVPFAEGMKIEAELYDRVSILQTMGRNAGWIALEVGDRADADATLIPEVQVRKYEVLKRIEDTMRNKGHALVVVSEGFKIGGKVVPLNSNIDPFGNHKLGGVRFRLEHWLRDAGIPSVSMAPDYAFRFGPPSEADADFAHMLGLHAMESALKGETGVASVLRDGRITTVPLSEISGGRSVPEELYDRKTLQKYGRRRHGKR